MVEDHCIETLNYINEEINIISGGLKMEEVKKTREVYKEKYNKLNGERYYIPQDGEEVVQIEECDYYFLRNTGYLESVYGKKIKVLKPYSTGKGGLKTDGTPKRRELAYKPSNVKPLYMSKLMMKYFPNKFINKAFTDEFINNLYETHHIHCDGGDMSKSPQEKNRASNLQDIPISGHKFLTREQSKTSDQVINEFEKEINKSQPIVFTQQELESVFSNLQKQNETPYIYFMEYDLKDDGKCKKSMMDNISYDEVKDIVFNRHFPDRLTGECGKIIEELDFKGIQDINYLDIQESLQLRIKIDPIEAAIEYYINQYGYQRFKEKRMIVYLNIETLKENDRFFEVKMISENQFEYRKIKLGHESCPPPTIYITKDNIFIDESNKK